MRQDRRNFWGLGWTLEQLSSVDVALDHLICIENLLHLVRRCFPFVFRLTIFPIDIELKVNHFNTTTTTVCNVSIVHQMEPETACWTVVGVVCNIATMLVFNG